MKQLKTAQTMIRGYGLDETYGHEVSNVSFVYFAQNQPQIKPAVSFFPTAYLESRISHHHILKRNSIMPGRPYITIVLASRLRQSHHKVSINPETMKSLYSNRFADRIVMYGRAVNRNGVG